MSDQVYAGRLKGSVSDVLDAGVDVLPHFEMAAISVLDGAERPAEWPVVKRRLRAEGVRAVDHRGVLLITSGELDHLASVGFFNGNDEVFLVAEWNEEFEAFPGRITTDAHDFEDGTPLGLDEWMVDSGCVLAVGDGAGVNFATLDAGLNDRLRSRFSAVKR